MATGELLFTPAKEAIAHSCRDYQAGMWFWIIMWALAVLLLIIRIEQYKNLKSRSAWLRIKNNMISKVRCAHEM